MEPVNQQLNIRYKHIRAIAPSTKENNTTRPLVNIVIQLVRHSAYAVERSNYCHRKIWFQLP